jgi:hypothetical protein
MGCGAAPGPRFVPLAHGRGTPGRRPAEHPVGPGGLAAELDNPNSALVRLLQDGTRIVATKDLRQRYGDDKLAIVDLTLEHTVALDRYRQSKENFATPPMRHEDLATYVGGGLPNFRELLEAVRSVPPGRAHATEYHRRVEALLTALFYPSLIEPIVEDRIHERRKRIDIRYTNVGYSGFFAWLARHHVPCKLIFVEAKNYTSEVGNPELDQLSGRFSPLRGQVGILVCRKFDDKALFLKRCRDTAVDGRGFVLALDDDDLDELVSNVEAAGPETELDPMAFGLLKRRYDDLIN